MWLVRLLVVGVVVAVPVVLVMTAVQLVMSETYLRLEYGRAGFPADVFGFGAEERFALAVRAVEYLRGDQGIDYLEGLVLSDGRLAFGERELRHMEDVKAVAGVFLGVYGWLILFLVGCVLVCVFKDMTTRIYLLQACLQGGLLTLALIAALLISAILGWNQFFEAFHRLFFADGTWRFEYSDTLIRLFPEQFWFDTALVIGFLTTGGATLLIAASRWALRRIRLAAPR